MAVYRRAGGRADRGAQLTAQYWSAIPQRRWASYDLGVGVNDANSEIQVLPVGPLLPAEIIGQVAIGDDGASDTVTPSRISLSRTNSPLSEDGPTISAAHEGRGRDAHY
jgi:hypothetical protein